MQRFRTIKGLILAAAFVVSLVLFAGMYLTTAHIHEASVKYNTISVSETLARETFNAMFQIMRRGWTRPQLEEFIGTLQESSRHAPYAVDIYRGEIVTALYGPINQKPIDDTLNKAFIQGVPFSSETETAVRYIYPLKARNECLRCHTNANIGDVLGVIEVKHDFAPYLEKAREKFIAPLLFIAPAPFLVALLVAMFLSNKVNRSIGILQKQVEDVNSVSDLKRIELETLDVGFAELNDVFKRVQQLASKLKSMAVDKDLLEFEIRLLEKFVITSEVVKDWREYTCYLLSDINQVIQAYTLFSIFRVDDELFDLEIFWIGPPEETTKEMMEKSICEALVKNPQFQGTTKFQLNHKVANPKATPIALAQDEIELQTKTLVVETPKIGGIVGIGVHADLVRDETRLLVMESILSTLLNVVGSVKAIYKYTRDLEYYATRDPLTNLYNQRLFWELLNYEVKRAERHNYEFALLVIDLDNFKSINDTFGHGFGDRFLQQFADCVHGALRIGDIMARYGGDEFVVILPETDAEGARTAGEHVLESASVLTLDAPDGTRVKATVSVGVAVYPQHATEVKDLFLFADNMMYKAKSGGKNRIGVASADEAVEVFRSIGERSIIIANAVEEKGIVPYFQPIVDVKTGGIEAVEVLSRIHLPDRILGAHEFIEIAERTGVIHKVDFAVMEQAFKKIREAGYQGKVFVNLSPRAFVLAEFIPEVTRLTTEAGISPEKVVFEITERDTVRSLAVLEKFVQAVKEQGFGLAIDDFGSGFSSFQYLKHLPVDYVKIEGDFIVNMTNDLRDRAFVHSIANLSRELGIKTVAEYVEREEVLRFVDEAGITFAQGYYIGRPRPDLSEVLTRKKDNTRSTA